MAQTNLIQIVEYEIPVHTTCLLISMLPPIFKSKDTNTLAISVYHIQANQLELYTISTSSMICLQTEWIYFCSLLNVVCKTLVQHGLTNEKCASKGQSARVVVWLWTMVICTTSFKDMGKCIIILLIRLPLGLTKSCANETTVDQITYLTNCMYMYYQQKNIITLLCIAKLMVETLSNYSMNIWDLFGWNILT